MVDGVLDFLVTTEVDGAYGQGLPLETKQGAFVVMVLGVFIGPLVLVDKGWARAMRS